MLRVFNVCRCATIHSLAFSADSLFLACTSNTETVHAFRLESPSESLASDSVVFIVVTCILLELFFVVAKTRV